ncbi:glucose/quinate/shikimate family membrane-bound PQQ-dependent dehydrogenase [soil metagenome]
MDFVDSPAPPRSGPAPSRMFARIFAGILVVVGVPVLAGGIWLATLGGSLYYLIEGLVFAVCGALVWRGNSWSSVLFAAMLLATWIWALGDAGADFWVLLSRLGFPLVLACGFLLPGVRRALVIGPQLRRGSLVAVAATLALLSGTAAAGWIGNRSSTQIVAESQVKLDYAAADDWQNYGGDEGGSRYSLLDQIGAGNLDKLAVAWTYRTGDYPPASGKPRRLEVTPIKIGDTLYLCTSKSKVIALDADTGRERWVYDPKVDLAKVDSSVACRGVAYYAQPGADPAAICATRILSATVDATLIAIDARTGQPCRDFGSNGAIDLTLGLGPVIPGYLAVSSAPVVVRGKVIVGGRISDGQSVGEPGSPIRAYDAISGKFAWAFDPGNPTQHGLPKAGKTFTRGTPNSWAPMSVDSKLGLVFLPTGNATPDYWGGHRTALDDRYSSSVIALDAETGAEHWTFQTTHHDVWDADVASQPSLVDLQRDGHTVPALLQPTKRGQLFLLDRTNGHPIAKVVERAVPQGGVAGERLSPTQPFSEGMPALDGLPLTESDMWGLTPFDALWCRIQFRHARWAGTLTPPSEKTYLQMPGGLGGVNWGGATIDPARKLAFIAWARLPMLNRLVPRAEADRMGLKPLGPGGTVGGAVAQAGTPYAAVAAPFNSPLGVPCVAPPYGMMSAIDLKTNRLLWSRRLGLASNNRVAGLRISLPLSMGVPLSGGSLATRSGLVFIGAVGDDRFRALDAGTGQTLWTAHLPAAANATPMTYMAPRSHRQMVVVAAGGHPMIQTDPGDYIIAFALKR